MGSTRRGQTPNHRLPIEKPAMDVLGQSSCPSGAACSLLAQILGCKLRERIQASAGLFMKQLEELRHPLRVAVWSVNTIMLSEGVGSSAQPAHPPDNGVVDTAQNASHWASPKPQAGGQLKEFAQANFCSHSQLLLFGLSAGNRAAQPWQEQNRCLTCQSLWSPLSRAFCTTIKSKKIVLEK